MVFAAATAMQVFRSATITGLLPGTAHPAQFSPSQFEPLARVLEQDKFSASGAKFFPGEYGFLAEYFIHICFRTATCTRSCIMALPSVRRVEYAYAICSCCVAACGILLSALGLALPVFPILPVSPIRGVPEGFPVSRFSHLPIGGWETGRITSWSIANRLACP